MLIDFTPNWALFLFSLFHIIDVWNMDEIESYDLRIECWQILRPIGHFFYFHYFTYERDETWIKLNPMTYEFIVNRFYAQLGFFYFRPFTW